MSGGLVCGDFILILSSSFTLDRYSSLIGKGKDEFDLFAQALGSSLPRITDSSTEEGEFKSFGDSGRSTSEGSSTENQEANSEPLEASEEKEKTPGPTVSNAILLTRNAMAGMMRMTQFVGKGDETESPSDFLADVEMAAQSWEVTFGVNADKPDATKIAIFRQNLDKDGDAWHWWTRVLSEKDKESFVSLKKAFLERYGAARNRAVSRFNVQNELMLLQQREGQSIADYVQEAESLSDRVPADMNNMLAMVFVRGLADQETRRRVSYDLRDEPEFTFGKALHMVK